MERFSSFSERTVLRESKESTLNKCINLTQEQKSEALAFFNGKGQSLWSSVDWNRPNEVTWETIKALIDRSQQSNSQMKKRMKNLSVGLNDIVEGQDYEITYSGEDYTLYHLLSHKGACVIASNKVYPPTHNYVPSWVADNNEWKETEDEDGKSDGAHWCISMFRTSAHWDDYTENGEHDFYVFCYNGDKMDFYGAECFKKVCLDISKDEEYGDGTETIDYWNGDDDTFNPDNHASWLRELMEDAVDKIDSYGSLSEDTINDWERFLDFFGGIKENSTGLCRTSIYRSDNYEMYLEFYNRNGKYYKDFPSLLNATYSRFLQWDVNLKVDVKGWKLLRGRLYEKVSDLGLDFSIYNGARTDLVISHHLRSTVSYFSLLNALKIIIQEIDNFAESDKLDAEGIWDTIKSQPQFEGWEEMIEEGNLVIDKFNDDYYIYVGILNVGDKTYNDKKGFLDNISKEKELTVYILGGVIDKKSWSTIGEFMNKARGGNLFLGRNGMAGASYVYRGDVNSDIIRPLLRDFTILSNATGI